MCGLTAGQRGSEGPGNGPGRRKQKSGRRKNLSWPLSTYSAWGVLPQGPPNAAESSAVAGTGAPPP
ncbi:hypothetical protein D3105_10815 [Streptomyces globisporus]|uniref:Uncharacterized protein n=1 Tax=Streptomyces globisporus TaxID=1908 RepID=A0A423V1M6_STRGL|nr:hypothetical protein D3105_10815 [Streptomyces globisporus]